MFDYKFKRELSLCELRFILKKHLRIGSYFKEIIKITIGTFPFTKRYST